MSTLPPDYWAGHERRVDMAAYAPQHDAIAAVLRELEWESVLDLGCGFGRMGMLVKEMRPKASYTGVDITPSLLASARRHLPDAEFKDGDVLDVKLGQRKWDLVMAVELLVHLRDDDAAAAVDRMKRWSRAHVVSCDWYVPGAADGESSFMHDYPALYGSSLEREVPVGEDPFWSRQTIFVAAV